MIAWLINERDDLIVISFVLIKLSEQSGLICSKIIKIRFIILGGAI
jgi:hypothetical protein